MCVIMCEIQRGDIIETIDGLILFVSRVSQHYLFGIDVTHKCLFMSERVDIEKRIKEVYYG